MDQQITVVVERDGKVRLAVEGIRGSQCLSVTAFLEKEMGEVCERQRTGDFYKFQHIALKNRITSENRAA
jgi:hypothetical protein